MATARGIVSFALALAFAAAIAHVAAARAENARLTQDAGETVLALEKRYYADLDAKNAFRQALAAAQGIGAEATAADAAEKLALLESYAEREFAARGIQADFWLGDAGPAEISAMRAQMLESHRALKPTLAADLSAFAVDWRGRPVRLAASMLAMDVASGKMLVARNAALVPEQPFLHPVFGVSIYSQGVAAVAIIGEGFHA